MTTAAEISPSAGPGEPVGGDSLAVDSRHPNRLGDVSRPEALAAGPREIVLDEKRTAQARHAIDRPGLRLGSGRAGSGHSSESDA